VKVLLYTSETDSAGLVAAHAAGADGVVSKSGSPTEFVEAVRAVAHGDAYADPHPTPGSPKRSNGRRTAREIKRLTAREAEIVGLLAHGLSAEEIAGRLFLSPATVLTHIRNARERIGAKTRSHLVALTSAGHTT
jgi:DNA-binding NarL/FixJ family response regulator